MCNPVFFVPYKQQVPTRTERDWMQRIAQQATSSDHPQEQTPINFRLDYTMLKDAANSTVFSTARSAVVRTDATDLLSDHYPLETILCISKQQRWRWQEGGKESFGVGKDVCQQDAGGAAQGDWPVAGGGHAWAEVERHLMCKWLGEYQAGLDGRQRQRAACKRASSDLQR